MGADSGVPQGLAQSLEKESSFRERILTTLLELIRDPGTDRDLKILIIAGSLDAVGISFVVTIGVLHVIVDLAQRKEPPLLWYAVLVGVLLALLMALAIPLVTKASSKEQALRLSESFNKICQARAEA